MISLLAEIRFIGETRVFTRNALEQWRPPTMGFEAIGLWWTDIYLMSENFRDIRTRRDEQRGAAYFKKAAFRDMEELVTALFTPSGDLALVERFGCEGLPALYSTD